MITLKSSVHTLPSGTPFGPDISPGRDVPGVGVAVEVGVGVGVEVVTAERIILSKLVFQPLVEDKVTADEQLLVHPVGIVNL